MDKKTEIIEQVEEINAMPRIALDLLGMINEPGITISELTKKIKLDEALIAYILRNCNSPLYGIKTEINSIPQALTLLGFTKLKTILMSYFNKNLYNITGKDEINNKLWIHSISVASYSEAIASTINANQETAYLSGLLHDIGKLIIYSSDNDTLEKVLEEIDESKKESYIIEKNILGFNHMEIGSLIMEKWKFSENLIKVCKFHHSAEHYNDKNKYICIVAFANILAHEEIEESQIDLSFFFNKYRLSEKKFEDIISTGLELKEKYLQF